VDRLVGYRLSPFLWSKVQKGIGAGRVQSVALRLVVDREDEIRAFVPVESWTVDALLSKLDDERQFTARLKDELKTEAEAAEAEGKVGSWINRQFGDRYLGGRRSDKARVGAQEAHEAIRPTDPGRRPEDIRRFLSNEQFRLYEMIWRRFVASRMAPAQYANTVAEIQGGEYAFRASGSVLTF